MLFALLGMTALAVDLGWFYLNAARIQRAADAGALAGVIRMPTDFPQAEADAKAATKRNGYEHGLSGVDVLVQEVPSDPNQLDVTVTAEVDAFFAQIFGQELVQISRKARGEFIPPLKLGSPDNTFGNTCDPNESGCNNQPNFWANIHGHWTQRSYGDAYSPACSTGNSFSCVANPLHRDRGYLYGIEAHSTSSFSVTFIDLAFHNTSDGVTTSDDHRTGDRGCEDGSWGGGASSDSDCGQTIEVNLYAPDADPLDVSNNTRICGPVTISPRPQVPESDPYTPESHASCLQNVSAGDGIYVLQVKVQDPGSVNHRSGLNRYSVQSSPGTSLFALGDMSIYNNAEATTEFYLAEVVEYYAGKTFVVELFDPGEGAAGYLQMIDPRTGSTYSGTCRAYEKNATAENWNLIGTPNPCQEHVSKDEYQDRWVKFEMDLPSDYSCTDCWWKVNYAYSGSVPEDTTTWKAYIVGNPIHLVPVGGE